LARSVHVREGRIGKVGELGGVADHGAVSLFLSGNHGKLVPDVHPVAIVAVNALATNFNFNLGDNLLSGEIQPTSIYVTTGVKVLSNLRKDNLEAGGVSQISISGDGAGYTATKVGLSVKGLFNGFNREISVPAVRYLPVGNLRITS